MISKGPDRSLRPAKSSNINQKLSLKEPSDTASEHSNIIGKSTEDKAEIDHPITDQLEKKPSSSTRQNNGANLRGDSENETSENEIAFNKDLSKTKDNISQFSDSLAKEEQEEDQNDESPARQKTSNTTQNVQKFVIPGKIDKNIAIRTSTVDVSAMSIKSNGNYSETGRASKTDAIRVNFRMYQNDSITRGNKEIYIVIQNPKGTVINESGKFMLTTGEEMPYTDQTQAYYDKRTLSVAILSGRFIQKIIKGTYIVKIYIEGHLTGQTLLILS